MPRLSAFYSIAIYMYIRDHGPPHIHGRYGGDEAVLEVSSGVVVTGALAPRQTRQVQDWVAAHPQDLVGAWDRASLGTSPGRIEPLP